MTLRRLSLTGRTGKVVGIASRFSMPRTVESLKGSPTIVPTMFATDTAVVQFSIRTILLFALTFGLVGCEIWSGEYTGDDPPRFVQPSPDAPKPRFALVLSGGGPRGFAHIGVLRALEQAGIRPDLIVGSSAGALVGALYADGRNAAQLEQLALTLDPARLIDFVWYSGRIRGQALEDFVNGSLTRRALEHLPLRFAAIATRADENKPVIFNAGAAGAALRASAATQTGWIGRFLPLRIREVAYVDGDVSAPLPVRAARTLGAQFVVAVDVSAKLDDVPNGAEQYRESDLARRRLVDAERPLADLVIHPDIGYWTSTSVDYRRRIIELAYREAQRVIPAIRDRLADSLRPRPG